MKFVTAKNAAEVKLSGVKVEFEHRDKYINSVMLTDGQGGVLKLVEESYRLGAYIPAPPTKVKKFRLAGKFAGMVEVKEDFDSQFEAQQKKNEYARKFSGADEDLGLAISEVEVEEEA